MKLTRAEFIDWILNNLRHTEFADEGSPLWNPEKSAQVKCTHFVMVKPLPFFLRYHRDGRGNAKGEYWNWVKQYCNGEVFCFLSNSDDKIEWWGFTDELDINWWLLRWSGYDEQTIA